MSNLLEAATRNVRAKLANKKLELSIPDAAQNVADAPLCLLSGLAAQFHVGRAKSVRTT